MRKAIAIAIIAILLAAILPAALHILFPSPVGAMTGSGTMGDPYIIYNATDLQDMNLVLTAYYELANDIDCINTTTWNGGAGFDPIGNAGLDTVKFRGHFDGNGYTISNLWINRPAEQDVGLWGYTLNADITDVAFHNCTVKGDTDVGVVVGHTHTTDWSYISVTDGNVSTGTFASTVGGFVGHAAASAQIEYCSFTGNVTPNSATYIGGFCGILEGGADIYRCWASTIIEALASSDRCHTVGGFIGRLGGSSPMPTIRECFSYGELTAYTWGVQTPYNLGGFVGNMYDMAAANRIYDCGSLVDVYATDGTRVGGFCGYIQYGDCDIYRCYSAGPVYGAGTTGGFLGSDAGGSSSTLTACFWDIQTSGWATSGGGEEIGRNTTDMKTESNYTDFSWDFTTIWGMNPIINTGYPYLLFTFAPEQLVWFQPIDIIHGTILPNRTGYEDGNFVWGGNPSGVSVEHGVWVPEDEYTFDIITPGGQDIIGPAPQALTADVCVTALQDNPAYPLIQIVSQPNFMTERIAWLGFAWLITIGAMFLVHIGPDTRKGTKKPHHFILTTVTGLGLSIVFYVMCIFPWWVIIIMAMGLVGAIIWERQPVI